MSLGDVLQTAEDYRRLAINKDNAHYKMALRYERRHGLLGVPVIITTTVVSTAIFASIQEQAGPDLKIATGLISISSVVLAALQTFFNYSDLAQRHLA